MGSDASLDQTSPRGGSLDHASSRGDSLYQTSSQGGVRQSNINEASAVNRAQLSAADADVNTKQLMGHTGASAGDRRMTSDQTRDSTLTEAATHQHSSTQQTVAMDNRGYSSSQQTVAMDNREYSSRSSDNREAISRHDEAVSDCSNKQSKSSRQSAETHSQLVQHLPNAAVRPAHRGQHTTSTPAVSGQQHVTPTSNIPNYARQGSAPDVTQQTSRDVIASGVPHQSESPTARAQQQPPRAQPPPRPQPPPRQSSHDVMRQARDQHATGSQQIQPLGK